MLEDRDYMRATPEFHGGWFVRLPVSIWLVILNVAFYAAQVIVPLTALPGHAPPRLEHYLALNPADILKGWVWQLLTFQVLHGGPFHLLINCVMLYIFGRPVEEALGRTHFLKLYFGSGAFGGLVQVGLALLFRQHFGYVEGMGWPSVVGASAGIFGLLAAFATLHYETPLTMLLYFVLPVTIKGKYLLWGEALFAVAGTLFGSSGVAHAAHLGGMIGGVFYVREVIHWQWRWHLPWPRHAGFRSRPRQLVSARRSTDAPHPRSSWDEDLSTDEFLAKQVDPILDKISAHGIQSLTDRERRILEMARRKMQKS